MRILASHDMWFFSSFLLSERDASLISSVGVVSFPLLLLLLSRLSFLPPVFIGIQGIVNTPPIRIGPSQSLCSDFTPYCKVAIWGSANKVENQELMKKNCRLVFLLSLSVGRCWRKRKRVRSRESQWPASESLGSLIDVPRCIRKDRSDGNAGGFHGSRGG